MQSSMKATLVFGLLTAYVVDASTVTPVQKVIELMEGMIAKGKKEKHEEQVQFAAYKQWCDDTQREKQAAIEEANEMIEVLKADIQKYSADIELLAKEIAKHEEDITVWNGDKEAATKVRDIGKTDYDAAHKDYSESIDALERAIVVLKKQAYDRKQAAALTQLSALNDFDLIPDDAKRAISAFLSQDPDAGLDVSAPEANAYEFQSQGILDMLNDLLKKFSDELYTLEKEETNSRNAYEMLMSDLKSQIGYAEAGLAEKKQNKARAEEAKAEAEGELADTTATRDDDMKSLEDVTATCTQKAADFESRQQLRAEELEAIQKAIDIISSNAVQGAAEKHLPGFLQTKGSALAQLRTGSRSPA